MRTRQAGGGHPPPGVGLGQEERVVAELDLRLPAPRSPPTRPRRRPSAAPRSPPRTGATWTSSKAARAAGQGGRSAPGPGRRIGEGPATCSTSGPGASSRTPQPPTRQAGAPVQRALPGSEAPLIEGPLSVARALPALLRTPQTIITRTVDLVRLPWRRGRVVVVGAGLGRSRRRRAAGRRRAPGHRLERPRPVGGKLGRCARAGHAFDTGPSLVTLPRSTATCSRPPVIHSRTPSTWCGWTRSSPTVLRRRAGAAPPVRRPRSARLDDGSRRRLPAPGRACSTAPPRMWRISETGPFLRQRRAWLAATRRLARRPGDLAAIAPWQSCAAGPHHLRDPRLRMLLDRYATYTGSDPRRAPGRAGAVPYAEQAFGGWYVRGGLHRLADARLERCLQLGASSAPAPRSPGRRCRGRPGDGVELADGEALRRRRGPTPTPPPVRRPAAEGPAPGRAATEPGHAVAVRASCCCSRCAAARRAGAPHRALPRRLRRRVRRRVRRSATGADPTVYVSRARRPGVRPDGHEAWFVLVNAPRHGPGGVDWDAPGWPSGTPTGVLDRARRRGASTCATGCAGARSARRPISSATPARSAARSTARRATGPPLSAPGPTARVPGLFLVGGSAHPGGGLPLVALSAEIVADLIGPA